MKCDLTGVPSPPLARGSYGFQINQDTRGGSWPAFINFYALQTTWLNGNLLGSRNDSAIHSGLPVAGTPPVIPFTNMLSKTINYNFNLSGITDYFWNPNQIILPTPNGTIMFADVVGNLAWVSPVIVGRPANAFMEYYAPSIQCDFVSTDGYTCTMRLTRQHNGGAIIDTVTTGALTMQWINDAAYGYPDPANPGNSNIVLVTKPVGKYNFGVHCIYTDITGGLGVYDCYSEMAMAVEIF